MSSLISVIIPSYNSGRYVVDAVESVLAQTYSSVEIIVIDDGSTDDTATRLSPYRDRVKYIFQPNGGLSRARNRGIEEAQGDWFAFLDADDSWLPTKLEKQLQCAMSAQGASLVHTDNYRFHDDTKTSVHSYSERLPYTGNCYNALMWQNMLIVSTVIVSRNCIESVGGFDENIHGATTQDYDLWIRIARRHRFAYVDEPLVLYRIHSSNFSRNARAMAEDKYYVLKKALQEDPELPSKLGREWHSTRLFEVAFEAGYWCAESEELLRARNYFSEARRCAPFNTNAWLYLASTFLPNRIRQKMRSLKRRFIEGLS